MKSAADNLVGGLQEALWRAAAFADAGADMLFIDALTSVEDMQAFCRAGGSAAAKPKVGSCALASIENSC